jgi:enoyl-CoA hydratase/carnithine racemase
VGRAVWRGVAYSGGMVHVVVDRVRLMDWVMERAHRLARRPRLAVAAAKRAIYLGGAGSLEHGLHVERAAFMETLSSKPARKGLRAYLDGLEQTGELPAYDPLARERLLDGSYTDLTTD